MQIATGSEKARVGKTRFNSDSFETVERLVLCKNRSNTRERTSLDESFRNGASESSVNKTINYEWFQFCEKKTSVFCETGGRMTYVGREEKGVGNPLRVCELSGSVAGSFPEWVVNVIEIICTSSQILG